MKYVIILIAAALVLLAGIGRTDNLGPIGSGYDFSVEAELTNQQLRAEIDSLRAELDRAYETNQLLEAKLRTLQQEINTLDIERKLAED